MTLDTHVPLMLERLSWRGTAWCEVQATGRDLDTLTGWGEHLVSQGVWWQCHLDLDLYVS